MGICLSMSVDKGQSCPFWFTKSDSIAFVWYITEVENGAGAFPNTVGKLVEHFGIDIKPLLKIGGQDFSIEELGIDEEEFTKYQESNQAAWQTPQELIDCLQFFVKKIDDQPDVFSKLEVEDGYFLRGTFRQDLFDILRMAEWAKESGAEKLRLEAA